MPRYVSHITPAKTYTDDGEWTEMDYGPRQAIDVYDTEPADTGLLDADGNPIMRVPDRIGFLSAQ